MRIAVAIFAGALALSSVSTMASDLVGTGFVKGKVVQLFDDGTWKYLVKPENPGCETVHEFVDFCATNTNWKPWPGAKFDFDKLYNHDERHFAGLIVEKLGTVDGMTKEGMINSVLSIAADASKTSVEEIPVHSVTETKTDDVDGMQVVYGAKIDGLNVVYANSITVQEALTIQVVTWAIGKEFTPVHQDLHKDFNGGVQINYEAPVQ